MHALQSLQNFQLLPLLNTTISLFVAFVLGTIIGVERQVRQRTAGLRTNVLVAVGAAAFVDLSMRLMPGDTRVIAYVVSGVGFLGAGAIMKDGVIVQIGNAEEIVTRPADDYVADFVAGISRIHLVKAHSIMQPVAAHRGDINALPRAAPEADISALIELTMQSEHDAIAVVDSGAVIGVVTTRDLLRGVAA